MSCAKCAKPTPCPKHVHRSLIWLRAYKHERRAKARAAEQQA